MIIYDKLKYFGNIVENKYGPIISNGGSFSFSGSRDKSCLLPEVGKSILR
jgi:hypothetical protein